MLNKLFISIFAVLMISGVVFADQFTTIRSNKKLDLSHKQTYTVFSVTAKTVTPDVLLGTVSVFVWWSGENVELIRSAN